MPTRALRMCSQPCCYSLVGPGRPCPMHPPRKPWDHKGASRQARGLGAEHDAMRKRVMAEERNCWRCGGAGLLDDQADHVRPRARGGTNERSNYRRAHRRCNQAGILRENA